MQWCTMYIVQYVQYVQYVFSARHNLYVYIHTTPTVRGSALEQRFRFFLGQCILVGVPLYIFYHYHLEIGFFFVQQCPTLLVVLHTYFFHSSYCKKQFLRNKRQDRQWVIKNIKGSRICSSFKNISLGFVTHGPVSKHAFRLNENCSVRLDV